MSEKTEKYLEYAKQLNKLQTKNKNLGIYNTDIEILESKMDDIYINASTSEKRRIINAMANHVLKN